MNTYFENMSKKYYNKGIIVDTNLLLLFVIGMIDKRRIESFKRTKQYLQKDFLLLTNYLSNFKQIITTPNILTEVNSFLNQLENNEKDKFFNSFSKIIKNLNESTFRSKDLSLQKDFSKFGLTDLSIYKLSQNSFMVLTDDLKLFGYLSNKNIDTINFNKIRTLNW